MICVCGTSLEPGREEEHQKQCLEYLKKLSDRLDPDSFAPKKIDEDLIYCSGPTPTGCRW
jgi:hypothetical protein